MLFILEPDRWYIFEAVADIDIVEFNKIQHQYITIPQM